MRCVAGLSETAHISDIAHSQEWVLLSPLGLLCCSWFKLRGINNENLPLSGVAAIPRDDAGHVGAQKCGLDADKFGHRIRRKAKRAVGDNYPCGYSRRPAKSWQAA